MMKINVNATDYTEKTVHVGIDVHKKTYAVTCICDGIVVKRATIKANPEVLVEFLKKHFQRAALKSAYEAGFSGFILHRYLIKNGIENSVVHPASIEISARDRVKTDKRDSLKIATQLASGRLKGIYIPSEEREAYRSVTRLRETLMKDKKRVGNQLKSFLYLQGLITDEEEKISKRWIKKVMETQCHPDILYCIQSYAKQWLLLGEKVREVEKHLEEQAKLDQPLDLIYQSAPGIGPKHARALSNELETMKQFHNEKGLFSFTGLTPSEYSSGEHKRQGHISRQGRPLLRKILIQAAWVAIKKDVSLKVIFERIAKQAGRKRAIVAIARRLIGRILACFITGSLYEIKTISDS